jgi:hypothetical protein
MPSIRFALRRCGVALILLASTSLAAQAQADTGFPSAWK